MIDKFKKKQISILQISKDSKEIIASSCIQSVNSSHVILKRGVHLRYHFFSLKPYHIFSDDLLNICCHHFHLHFCRMIQEHWLNFQEKSYAS